MAVNVKKQAVLDGSSLLADFIAQRSDNSNISCKSYIVTVFGDVLSQHGHWLWLGSLIDALQPLGFSERLIRTSVFRLVQEDWLQTKKIGRCSYYAFTDSAKRHYDKAARRIYSANQAQWHGNWLIVLPTFVPEEQMPHFRKQLHWLGFSTLTSGVFAHPSIDQISLEETLSEMNLTDSVVVFTSKTLGDTSAKALKKLVQHRWQLDDLAQQYQQLLTSYQTVVPLLLAYDLAEEALTLEQPDEFNQITDQQCFLLRTLLIHEYRRILLKDHQLPPEMLPQAWSGFSAHQLVNTLYRQLAKPSLRYICETLKDSAGFVAKEQSSYWQRFS